MSTIELKAEIMDLVSREGDKDKLDILYAFLRKFLSDLNKNAEEDLDWWEELSPEQQQKLDESSNRVRNTEYQVPHEQVLNKLAKWKQQVLVA